MLPERRPTQPSQPLPWISPLDAAAAIREPYWALLYSGVDAGYSGRTSYLAYGLAERIEASDFSVFGTKLASSASPLSNAWFGFLGYGLKNTLECLPRDRPNSIALPDLCMMRFDSVYRFDHAGNTVTGCPESVPVSQESAVPECLPPVSGIGSNMTRQEYLSKAAEIIESIRAGELYQANLTRKFFGEFAEAPDPFILFRKLCAESPAPYSAYLRLGDTHILSSSPELFLRIGADGKISARPIKGTAPRFADPMRDAVSRQMLTVSEKDRAENLMIVDLMRNDLARACIPGSVTARDMFEVTTHATIHHMSSTITGQKRPDCTTLEAVKHCFPPGSMTGAPKIRAMELCSQLEKQARGVYGGAVGWFGGDGSAELSVVIRTLIVQGTQFEFQAGGGIVADSTPEGELKEMIAKCQGILRALGLPLDRLDNL